jgi:hypothetical protein
MVALNFNHDKKPSVKVNYCNICNLDGSECRCQEEARKTKNFLDAFADEIAEENNV